MGNNTTDSKLDETIKDTLKNYEAKYDAGDWSRMENMLDAAPKSSSLNWSYKLSIIVGIALIGGGYLIYKTSQSSKTSTEKIIETPSQNTTEKVISTPPPAASTNTPAVKETPALTTPSVQKTPEIPKNEGVTSIVKNEITPAEKIKKDKKIKSEDLDSTTHKTQKVSIMGNEPVFGDMIDSSKGIIHETKEKERLKKAAKSKGTSNIGLRGLLNINADSIRKQSEQMKKDTSKNK